MESITMHLNPEALDSQLSIVLSIVIQSVAIIWWASRMSTRVDRIEKDLDQHEKLQREDIVRLTTTVTQADKNYGVILGKVEMILEEM